MRSHRWTVLLAASLIAFAAPVRARAHFLWITPDPSPNARRVHVYFSETAEPDNPALLSRLKGLTLKEFSPDGKEHLLAPSRDKDSLASAPAGTGPAQSYSLSYTFGLHSRGGETYLLVYHARMYPAGPKHAWSPPPSDQRLALEIVPSAAGGKLHVRVLWQGQPVDAAEVKADRPGNDSIEGTTNAAGEFSIPIGRPGLYALRAKHIEKMAGTWEGKRYASVRHYGTLVVTIADDDSRAVQSDGAKRPKRLIARADMKHPKTVSTSATAPATAGRRLPDLPFGVTSFGAALVGQTLYVCEGHLGPAHEYAVLEQSDGFLRLNLSAPKKWELVGTVPRRAGLAMVSSGNKVYRIGGFEARNQKDETADLHSTRDFSRFDPATGHWDDLTPLPAGRSSHEAVAVDNRIYVVGGWELRGSSPSVWHDTALQIDLSAAHPVWTELPKPPFHRRALGLGAYGGKLYALGGMQEQGGPTTTTYVLDLARGQWSPGPKLPGEGLEGFGGCAVTCAGRLYATTYAGQVSCLAENGQAWQDAGRLPRARFFHRMLSADNASLVILGGANMEEGKDLSVDTIPAMFARRP